MRASDTDRTVATGVAQGNVAQGTVAPGKPDTAMRHPYGPRPLGALLPQITRPVFRRRAPATAQLLIDWDTIVGPALAAVTTPRRRSAGTLTIACAGPVALELQHLAAEIISRINIHSGGTLVARLRFVQDMRPLETAPPTPIRRPAIERANHAVQALPPGPLRDALAALGSVVLADAPGSAKVSGAPSEIPRAAPSTARPIEG